MYRALKRSWFWVAFVGLLGGAASYALSLGLEERYTSVAQVMIETRVNEDTQFTPFLSNLPISLTSLESELEVLRSLDLVERVVDRLQLQDDPEFFDPSGFEEELASPDAPGAANPSDFNLQREQTIANVADRREIEQVGNISAVYAIRFTTSDARKSAALANMLAEEYVSTTRNEKLRSLELSQGWLTQRVSQLQERLSDLGVQLEQNLLSAPYSPDEIETIKARNVATERRLNQFESEARDIDATIGRINGLLSQGRPVLAAATLEQPSSDIEDLLAAAKAGA
ncbi:MAG TPA: Wzz/FepE/Etk N-terminal domain-containing protein, partial [Terrimesophilobacter sp.]|nr:Wzz/FepE/Etk N-terminal domain-containing protein [Terrimesophilobacter sp.]